MDITKYILTIGLIGGILTEKITIVSGILIVIVAVIIFTIAFFTIPQNKEGE